MIKVNLEDYFENFCKVRLERSFPSRRARTISSRQAKSNKPINTATVATKVKQKRIDQEEKVAERGRKTAKQ